MQAGFPAVAVHDGLTRTRVALPTGVKACGEPARDAGSDQPQSMLQRGMATAAPASSFTSPFRKHDHASPEIRPQVQPYQRTPRVDVQEHGLLAVQARPDQDHLPKAKELRRVAEPLITMAKTDSVANRRLAFARLRDKAVGTLFTTLGPRYQTAGRLPAHPQVRFPCRRQCADGLRRAGRSPDRAPRKWPNKPRLSATCCIPEAPVLPGFLLSGDRR
jgi:hypothetical protein